jgi:hypothetical protein
MTVILDKVEELKQSFSKQTSEATRENEEKSELEEIASRLDLNEDYGTLEEIGNRDFDENLEKN